jgi:hypothetical protein
VPTLFMANLPHNCTESELTDWTETSGIRVSGVRMIRDMVAGVSPCFAYVDIGDGIALEGIVNALNGRVMRDRIVLVTEARRRTATPHTPGTAA